MLNKFTILQSTMGNRDSPSFLQCIYFNLLKNHDNSHNQNTRPFPSPSLHRGPILSVPTSLRTFLLNSVDRAGMVCLCLITLKRPLLFQSDMNVLSILHVKSPISVQIAY